MHNIWLHRYATLVAVCTLFLVVAGGLVTSNEAGLSVPDWPLSFGQWMPPMEGGVFYEHGHRMVATTVGLLTVLLAIWLWRADERRWMKWLGLAAVGAVVLQGLLGGLTVLYKLPKPVSISHACLAQLFFSTTMAIARFTSPGWRQASEVVKDSGWPSIRSLALAVPVVLLGQVALGAATRHGALGLMPHVLGALVATAVVLLAGISIATQYGSHGVLRPAAWHVMGITVVQVFLGIAAYLSRIYLIEAGRATPLVIGTTVAHVAVGALTMAAGVLLAIQTFRHVRRAADDRLLTRAAQ